MLYDTLEAAANPLPHDGSKILEAAQETWLKGSSAGPKYPTGISLAEACAWALHGEVLKERWPNHKEISVAKAMLPFLGLDGGHTLSKTSELETIPSPYLEGRLIFGNTMGFFGYTHRKTQPGDRVCLLLGCP